MKRKPSLFLVIPLILSISSCDSVSLQGYIPHKYQTIQRIIDGTWTTPGNEVRLVISSISEEAFLSADGVNVIEDINDPSPSRFHSFKFYDHDDDYWVPITLRNLAPDQTGRLCYSARSIQYYPVAQTIADPQYWDSYVVYTTKNMRLKYALFCLDIQPGSYPVYYMKGTWHK